jgi:hypothetical protein
MTPCKPIPALESKEICRHREEGSGNQSSYQKRQRRLRKKLQHLHAWLADRRPSNQHAAKLILCQQDQRRRQRIANPGRGDRRGNVHPSQISDQRRRQHLKWQRHHGEKNANRTPRSEASAVGLPHFLSKEPLPKLSVQPRTPQMFDPRQVPQIRTRRTPPPLMGLHLGETRSTIFPRISACQHSFSCLNTLMYEEN